MSKYTVFVYPVSMWVALDIEAENAEEANKKALEQYESGALIFWEMNMPRKVTVFAACDGESIYKNDEMLNILIYRGR